MRKINNLIIASLLGLLAATANASTRLVLNTKNTIVYRGAIDDAGIQRKMTELSDLVIKRGRQTYPLYLVLDSPGGSIVSGLDFIEFAKTIQNLHTVTLFSASMAAAIVEALPGDRLITQTGFIMFHRASGVFRGQFEMGEVESRLEMAKSLVLIMEKQNAARLGMTLSQYKQTVVNELWLMGQQAVDKKAADRTVTLVCTKELIRSTTTETYEFLFARKSVKFSNCPLFRAPVLDVENVYEVPNALLYKQRSINENIF